MLLMLEVTLEPEVVIVVGGETQLTIIVQIQQRRIKQMTIKLNMRSIKH
jgi:hypothetical protein